MAGDMGHGCCSRRQCCSDELWHCGEFKVCVCVAFIGMAMWEHYDMDSYECDPMSGTSS